MGRRPHQARPVAAVREHARHAVLPRLHLGAVLEEGIRPPLRRAARQDARAQARRHHRGGRPEPLELRRRHALAHRPLGVACAGGLRAGAARRRADADLLDGRHACGSGAAAGRGRGQGRAPQPQRPLLRHHGGAAARAEARARAHRTDGDRSAAQRLHAGQPVQRAAPQPAGRRARLHLRLPARAAFDPQRGGARLRPQGRQAVRGRDERHGRARRAGREGIRAARRGGRRHPGRRRRHRLPDHRLDADGQSGADLRQSAAVRRAC